MENLTSSSLLVALLPIIGGVVGYGINDFLAKRREIESAINREKREAYQIFLDLLIDTLATVKKGEQPDQKHLIQVFYDFQKRYLMYASPEVINAFGDCWESFQKKGQNNAKDSITNMTKLILFFRKDLGLSNKNLGESGEKLFRSFLTDYENFFKN